jgi:hypothetical protein
MEREVASQGTKQKPNAGSADGKKFPATTG